MTTRRRRRGEGGMRKRADGRYEGYVSLGWGDDGKRKRKYVTGRTQREATDELLRLRAALDVGLPMGDRRTTINEVLDSWLTRRRAADLSPNTVEHDEWAVRRIRIAIGRRRLVELTVDEVDKMLCDARDEGLSLSCVRRLRNALARALREAERRGLVARNVADLSEVPKCKPPQPRRALDAEQARAMLAASRGERLGALVWCGLHAWPTPR